MIGQEDTGNLISKYYNELSDLPSTANYFFHAGETSKRIVDYLCSYVNLHSILHFPIKIGMAAPTGT